MEGRADTEVLYRQHALAVFRFALGLCRSRSEAEDITADVFARILLHEPVIEAATARAYLLTVARNLFLDRQKRIARESKALEEIERSAEPHVETGSDADLLATALGALASLPEGERAALLLRLDHGLSYEEIAAALQISIAAAKVRVHRARVRLTRLKLHTPDRGDD